MHWLETKQKPETKMAVKITIKIMHCSSSQLDKRLRWQDPRLNSTAAGQGAESQVVESQQVTN